MSDELFNRLQQLKEISKEFPKRLDEFIPDILEAMYNTGVDIATFAMPVIIQFQENSLITWENFGTVQDDSRAHNQDVAEIQLRVMPENLYQLLQLPDVKNIAAYRKKRSSN